MFIYLNTLVSLNMDLLRQLDLLIQDKIKNIKLIQNSKLNSSSFG